MKSTLLRAVRAINTTILVLGWLGISLVLLNGTSNSISLLTK